MEIGRYLLSVDVVCKFYNSLYISGWFHHALQSLTDVAVVGGELRSSVNKVGLPHGGVERDLGQNKGFSIQALRSTDGLFDLGKLELVFTTSDAAISVSLRDLIEDKAQHSASFALSTEFARLVGSGGSGRLLDVGGRNRSKIDRSRQFPGVETIVLDILPGDNVDVVGDAHEMSALFPDEYFDFAYSVSVFEHLAMPWKVVCEMNRVMKTGGIGLVHSHQTIGIHDAPWDFYRFSDNAWHGLFNERTGFEVLRSVMDHPQYLIPSLYRDGKEDAERSAGFESSTVMFRKIGPCKVTWDVPLSAIIDTSYPQA